MEKREEAKEKMRTRRGVRAGGGAEKRSEGQAGEVEEKGGVRRRAGQGDSGCRTKESGEQERGPDAKERRNKRSGDRAEARKGRAGDRWHQVQFQRQATTTEPTRAVKKKKERAS